MEKIYTSATKIVFLLTALTVCVGFFMNLVPVEQFMALATMVFAFYYANKKTDDGKVSESSLG